MCCQLLCRVNDRTFCFFNAFVSITPHNIPQKRSTYNELSHSISPLLSRHDGNFTESHFGSFLEGMTFHFHVGSSIDIRASDVSMSKDRLDDCCRVTGLEQMHNRLPFSSSICKFGKISIIQPNDYPQQCSNQERLFWIGVERRKSHLE